MRNAESFVEIQMAHIGSEITRTAQADLRVHVGAVHVNLATSAVDYFANVADALLEHAMGRGIGHHDRSEVFTVEIGFRSEIGEIDVAVGVTGDGDDLHSNHHGTGRVGAVRGGRDEANRAVCIAARVVVGPDG